MTTCRPESLAIEDLFAHLFDEYGLGLFLKLDSISSKFRLSPKISELLNT